MQFRKTLGGLAVAFALASGGVAPSSVAADLKDFDFKYDLDGDRAAQPVQVFDDGHHTYFQFRSNVGLPVISAVTSAGRKVLNPEVTQPYVVVTGVYPAFALTAADGSRAIVNYAGPRGDLTASAGQRTPEAPAQTGRNGSPAGRQGNAAAGSGEEEGLLGKLRRLLGADPEPPRGEEPRERVRADRIASAAFFGEAISTPVGASDLTKPSGSSAARPADEIRVVPRAVVPAEQDEATRIGLRRGSESLIVAFGKGSAALYAPARRQLLELADAAARTSRVLILASGDRAGRPHLAGERARAIRSVLLMFGVAPSQIELRTVGSTDDAGNAEVLVLDANSSSPQAPSMAREGSLMVTRPADDALSLPAEAPGGDGSGMRSALRTIASLYERKAISREQAEERVRALAGERAAAARPRVPVQAIPGPASETAQSTWAVRLEDKTLRRAMERWGRAGGYQVAWEASVDFPVKLEATFTGGFEDAVKAVMRSLRDTQTPMEALIYDNKVVRVVPAGTRSPTQLQGS